MATQSTTAFGALLRTHRVTAGLTQEALAERAGLSVYGIRKLEAGTTHPYRDTAQRLILALELTSEDAESSRPRSSRCAGMAARDGKRPPRFATTCQPASPASSAASRSSATFRRGYARPGSSR